MTQNWRVIIDPPATGAWNMAVDEALLQSAIRGDGLPTLRLYSWQPGCLSLGRAQPIQDVDKERTQDHEWDIVRRLSGGRAILHIDELTYSFTGNINEPLFQNEIIESYLRIARGLVRFLNLLEISPEINHSRQADQIHKAEPICFEVPSQYEITYQGRKLIGSAQARKENGVLQHGSIPLFGDITRITQCLRYEDEPKRSQAAIRMHSRACTLEEVLSKKVELVETIQPFIQAFQVEHELSFVEGTLTGEEKSLAESLAVSKYGSPEWNERI